MRHAGEGGASMKAFADLADLPEDDRIRIIGEVAEAGQRVGFVVDDDTVADRYIEKLMKRFRVTVVARGAGPVKNTIAVAVSRRPDA